MPKQDQSDHDWRQNQPPQQVIAGLPGTEQDVDADARWFLAHPEATRRTRRISTREMLASGHSPDTEVTVIVQPFGFLMRILQEPTRPS